MELFEVGIRFFPTDEELMHHLRNKIADPRYHHQAIVETDLYKQEPWCLPWDPAMNKRFHGNERYFFHARKAVSGKAKGKRTRRTVEKDGVVVGHWHGNSGYKDICDRNGNPITGYVSSLTYFIRDKGQPEGKGIKTDWIMHEYVMDVRNAQEWCLYRIRYNGKVPLVAATNSTDEFDGSQSEASTVVSGGGPDPLPPSKRQKTSQEYTSPRPLLLSSNQEAVQEEFINMVEEGISVEELEALLEEEETPPQVQLQKPESQREYLSNSTPGDHSNKQQGCVQEEFWENIGDLEEPEVLKILESTTGSSWSRGFEQQGISMAPEALELYGFDGFDLDIEAPPPRLLDLECITKPVETDQALVVKTRVPQLEQPVGDQHLHPEGCSGDHGNQQGVEGDFLENLNSELLSCLLEEAQNTGQDGWADFHYKGHEAWI